MVVDLPAPFGPRKPNVSPRATSKSMPRTASMSPYFLVSPETCTAGGRAPAGPGASASAGPAPVIPSAPGGVCAVNLRLPLRRVRA